MTRPWNGLPERVSFWLDMALIYLVFLPGLFWFFTRTEVLLSLGILEPHP